MHRVTPATGVTHLTYRVINSGKDASPPLAIVASGRDAQRAASARMGVGMFADSVSVGGGLTVWLIPKGDDPARKRLRFQQFQLHVARDASKQRLAFAQRRRVDLDAILINQVELREGLEERDAAEKPDILARLAV